jgi:hypothetical protein
MAKEIENMDLEKQKIELVKLRIANGYYNREDVLRKVVNLIFNKKSKTSGPH